MNKKQKRLLFRILAAAGMMAVLVLLPDDAIPWQLSLFLYLIPYFTVGFDILRKSWKGICNGQVFDENFLMTIATIGAVAVGIYEHSSSYTEAVAVMLLYQVGELFQGYAVGKSRRSIVSLMDIRPDTANLLVDGEWEETDPEDIPIGSLILVRPGEKIPLDGIVEEGVSTLNTSALTGESIPRDIGAGEEALSGCINMTGILKIRTTAEFEESTASRILDLVENAASRKSKSENFISRFARYYTPAVCFSALVLALLPPLFSIFAGQASANWSTWLYRACIFLVISCPCAVVISIPLSFFAGLGAASRQGILIKGSNYLETLSLVKTVAFDKTGTMTKGSFEVTGIHHSPMEEKKVLEYAALLESYSSHPISASLQRAYGQEIDRSRVGQVEEIGGFGVKGKVDDIEAAAGTIRLMEQVGVSAVECHSTGTIVHMAIGGTYAGHIVVSDEVKPQAEEAVRLLKEAGIRKTVMLTGDLEKPAKEIAGKLGIDEVYAGLLPEDKVTVVEKLLKENKGKEKLAFVGDGINDAPVLSRADIGIAMGAIGSDAAIEAADVVLMNDDPRQIAKAVRISRKCLRIVWENILFALAVKMICLVLGALGMANMWIAILSDVGVMVLCVLNAIRALL